MNNNMKKIIIYAIICCTILYFTEVMGYGYKVWAKILGFVIIPYLIGMRIVRSDKSKTSYKWWLSFWWAVFLLILWVYYLLRDTIDLVSIRQSLEAWPGVTKEIYHYVAAYITFWNSFLEEYFFRWIIFMGLLAQWFRKTAYLFSAGLFSLYHVVIFIDWFTIPVFILVMFGLFTWWLLFNWLTEKGGSFVNAWIFHVFADLAIVGIGALMFYVV